jgi:hypothetical protein
VTYVFTVVLPRPILSKYLISSNDIKSQIPRLNRQGTQRNNSKAPAWANQLPRLSDIGEPITKTLRDMMK